MIRIGTVIHGTLRPQDLIPAFIGVLKEVGKDVDYLWAIDDFLNNSNPDDVEKYFEGEIAQDDIELLIKDINDNISDIPFLYFGCHPSDGSDFGFWVDYDSLEGFVQSPGFEFEEVETKRSTFFVLYDNILLEHDWNSMCRQNSDGSIEVLWRL